MISSYAKEEDLQTEEVASSQIKEIGHTASGKAIYIRFGNGSIYRYSPSTQEDYDNFSESESKGKHFHSVIKRSINATKIHNG